MNFTTVTEQDGQLGIAMPYGCNGRIISLENTRSWAKCDVIEVDTLTEWIKGINRKTTSKSFQT